MKWFSNICTRNVTVYHLISILLFINTLDKQLKYLEANHHLPCRWDPADREYTEERSALSLERNSVGEAMWAASSQWQYLLKSKAKYAGTSTIMCM